MFVTADLRPRASRRGFLAAGTLGTIAWPQFAALGAGQLDSLVRDRSVVFVFQQGGPSQFETFDPKPDAPDGVRSVGGAISTSLPGVQFGATFTQLAQRAHYLTVVRSFQTNNAGHNIQPIVGPETLEAQMGVLLASVIGATHPTTGMPTNAVLFPQAVDGTVTRGSARGNISATGTFGAALAPFVPGAGSDLQKNMRLTLSAERFRDRHALLTQFNQQSALLRDEEQGRVSAELIEQARQLLIGDRVASAFDLSQEADETLSRYDTQPYARPDLWKPTGRGQRGYYAGHTRTMGKLMLLARRLCEAGCRFVTVHADYEGVWDMHADGNNLNVQEGMEIVGRAFDHAIAAFIDDVESRGLSDKILLVCCGEMGRTPKINRNGGRDHWGRLSPLMMYGVGTRGGTVIGQSTRDGAEPATTPYTPASLVSTLLHQWFDTAELRLRPALTPLSRLAEVTPIPVT